MMSSPLQAHLPSALQHDEFRLLRHGIHDDPDVDVWINTQGDFAFLHPMPKVDYAHYAPRMKTLGLSDYKAWLVSDFYGRRTEKLMAWLRGRRRILEIGGADGAYLSMLHDRLPEAEFSIAEPDQDTLAARRDKTWLHAFGDLDEVKASGRTFDAIMMFHVFEHISEPRGFLDAIRDVLAPGGVVIAEVPCLADPLLTVHAASAYEAFYFQCQHPFVYSGPSITRVFRDCGYADEAVIPFQRYGLENHMTWLGKGRPGGDANLAMLTAEANVSYIRALEADGRTDTVILVAASI